MAGSHHIPATSRPLQIWHCLAHMAQPVCSRARQAHSQKWHRLAQHLSALGHSRHCSTQSPSPSTHAKDTASEASMQPSVPTCCAQNQAPTVTDLQFPGTRESLVLTGAALWTIGQLWGQNHSPTACLVDLPRVDMPDTPGAALPLAPWHTSTHLRAQRHMAHGTWHGRR